MPLNVSASTSYVFQTDFTIMLWVKPNSADGVTRPILVKAAKDYQNQYIKLTADDNDYIFSIKKD